MLANFFIKFFHIKLKLKVCLFFVLFSQIYYSQYATELETITESDGLPSNYVFNVTEDQQNRLWIGTDKGLATFRDGKWILFNADSGMPGNYINQLTFDGKNGLLMYISEKGLYYFNIENKHITNYPEINNRSVLNIKRANKNSDFVIITLFDKKTNQNQYLAFDNKNTSKLIPLYFKNLNGKNYFFIHKLGKETIISDDQIFSDEIYYSNLLLKKTSFGIVRTLNNKVVDTLSEKDGLENHWINSLFKRKNGDVFISTLGGGISVLRNHNFKILIPNNNSNARDIFYENNKIYLLSDGFLYIFNKSKIFTKLKLGKDALTFFVEGNKIYIGSFSGLQIYNLKDEKLELIKKFPFTVGISKILKINNTIIFSTYGSGIFTIENDKIKQFDNKPFNNIENLYKINDGYGLVSYESGVSIVDNQFKFKFHLDNTKGLVSNFATCVFSDNDTIFVGTKNGVTAFLGNKPVLKFTKFEGFVGDITRNIFRDQENKIWILTDKSLLRKSGKILKPFGSLNLLNNNEDSVLKGNFVLPNDDVLIVSKNQISIVKLNEITPNKFVPNIYLDKIIIDKEMVEKASKYKLPDHNKGIEFIFNSVDEDYFNRTKLYYKVNNGIWKPFNEPRTLKFYHLDQGEYVLNVKAINSDGFERFYPQNIKFKVLGPVYLRWWFLLLFFSVFGYFMYNYIDATNKKKYVRRLNELRIRQRIEIERKRISRDLHDNIGAYVTSLISKIDLLKINSAKKENLEFRNCDDIRLDAENILLLLRQTIWILSNKETNIIAFYDNFKSYATKFLKNEKVRMVFEEKIENNRILDATTGSGIFRIMQEALQNIYKHANATKIVVNIISEERLKIYINDNGVGFNSKELNEGFGILNMRERAKELGFKLFIYSDSSGTTLEILEL